MIRLSSLHPAIAGPLCAVVATLCFSINDTSVKFLSGGYALHEVILLRSLIALAFLLGVLAPLMADGWGIVKTRRLGSHLLRGVFVALSNMTYFLALAALPLAEATAIFFVSPLILTVFSVVFLREEVGVRRWAAIGIGLAGVIVMMRPGTSTFQLTSLLPLISAVFYAAMHTMTRRIGDTESALTMAFYIQITFVAVSIGFGLAVGDGRFAAQDNASLAFLLRGWEWPSLGDVPIFLLIGVAIAIGGFFISQAYRVAIAATVSPFEYIALPLAIVWGIAVFGEWPDAIALLGMAMIIGSGLFTIWREAQAGVARRGPKLRR